DGDIEVDHRGARHEPVAWIRCPVYPQRALEPCWCWGGDDRCPHCNADVEIDGESAFHERVTWVPCPVYPDMEHEPYWQGSLGRACCTHCGGTVWVDEDAVAHVPAYVGTCP